MRGFPEGHEFLVGPRSVLRAVAAGQDQPGRANFVLDYIANGVECRVPATGDDQFGKVRLGDRLQAGNRFPRRPLASRRVKPSASCLVDRAV